MAVAPLSIWIKRCKFESYLTDQILASWVRFPPGTLALPGSAIILSIIWLCGHARPRLVEQPSRVAQLVARLAHTQKVIGSNPISALVEDKAMAPPISQHTVMRG